MWLVRRNASWQDLCDLPDTRVGELIGGDLYATAGHAPVPGYVVTTITSVYLDHFGRRRASEGITPWWIFHRPECHLDADVLVPDVAGWHRERVPRPGEWRDMPPPDWACEVFEPDSAAVDRYKKLPIYARAGVRHVWLVDPVAHFVEVLELQAPHWLVRGVYGGEATARIAPFEGLEVDLAEWWPDTEPPPS